MKLYKYAVLCTKYEPKYANIYRPYYSKFKYARKNMHEICQKYAYIRKKYPDMQLYVKDMLKTANLQTVLVKYAKDMHKICPKYAQICILYAVTCYKYAVVCTKYAQNMQIYRLH